MIGIEEAKVLQYGDVLIDDRGKRWRVTGKVQTWKRDASRIRVPLKHGLYTYGSLSDHDFTPFGTCDFMTKEEK